MFRDLCSCHKNKNKKNSDEDDLPYTPGKNLYFFGLKKSSIFEKNLQSTPNQLVQVRKINENDNLDIQNNNKYSTNSRNSSSTFGNSSPKIVTSPIEMDNSNNFHNLDRSDDLNRLDDQFNMNLNLDSREIENNQNNQATSINLTDSNLNQSVPNDNHNSSFNKPKNNSSTNLAADSPTDRNNLRLNHSTNNLNELELNGHLNRFKGSTYSFTDSTDNMLQNLPVHIHRQDHFKSNEEIQEHNVSINMDQFALKDDLINHENNKDSLSANENIINNLINLPTNTNSLKRVSSDDKLSQDTSSIDSVILDRQSNEIVKKSSLNDQMPNPHQHPNSIIIQERLKLTLKRDKSDKKSLNEFSIENMSRQLLNTSSFVKEYFYDDPIIRTSSKFIPADLATYRMQSNPRGFCLIINNATVSAPCLRLRGGFVKEVNYFKDVFTKLGFNVQINDNIKAGDILKLMKKVKRMDFSNHDAFVCIYLGHGNQNYVIGEDNFKLNFELMIGTMNNYHCKPLVNKPKIFISHTCDSTCQTFLEPIPPSNIPREIQALKKITDFKIIPTWTDTVIIYSRFVDSDLSYSPFVKEFGLVLCESACDLSLHDILLKTNNQIFNKKHYKDQYGLDFNYRGLNKILFFNPNHFI